MSYLSDHPVSRLWPAEKPEVLQLYSFPTPNGVKVSIALEETGLPYEPHTVRLSGDQKRPEFLALNPNNKIPAIIDPDGPQGKPQSLFESGAILLYIAEKTGKLLPEDPALRYEAIQWVMFQVGGVGPMFGQFGHFHMGDGKEIGDPRPKKRYAYESRRLLSVLEQRLTGRDWIMGDAYSIADIAVFPWVRALRDDDEARELVGLPGCPNVLDWVARAEARPASRKGLGIPDRDGGPVEDREAA